MISKILEMFGLMTIKKHKAILETAGFNKLLVEGRVELDAEKEAQYVRTIKRLRARIKSLKGEE